MQVQPTALHEATRERYLNYALSVITSRALPDVRDGLKPVQRRILYTMFKELSLSPNGRYRKCAAVVGDVMGKYHPHGDQSIYDALVRMSQSFTLRAPLVDGQGNFGSVDGDRAAAMRYTECRLTPISEELLSELKKRTVNFRPNYDGQRFEPVVLPAQFPQLLVNGVEGIAVGMATRIPPHNLGEVIDATVALIDKRSLTVRDLLQYLPAPDFPTGGELIADSETLAEMYETGRGTIKLRATWEIEKLGRRRAIIINSIPHGQNKAKTIERIGEAVMARKLPQIHDIRDESTEDIRVVIELKQGASADAVMAYIYKHTQLQVNVSMNMTVLTPVDDRDLAIPARLDLRSVLIYWLDFRFETVRRRFRYELELLLERIHLLEGFELIFDCLDETIKIIRASEGKRDAAEQLMDRFDISDEQVEAILELKLYKLARLEILLIREELAEKRAEADRIQKILSSDKRLWSVVRSELVEIRSLYADARRTAIAGHVEEFNYDADAYITKESAFVVISKEGWFKRQSSFSEISKVRTRDDDEVRWVYKTHTRATITFFTSHGGAYTLLVDTIPPTTGYGEPVQAHFQFEDGERVVGVISNDAAFAMETQQHLGISDTPPPPWAIGVTKGGKTMRFSLTTFQDVSTKRGRRFARLASGDRVFIVYPTDGTETLNLATVKGRALVFDSAEVNMLRAAGRGVTAIKLQEGDSVMAAELCTSTMDGPTVVTAQGREFVVRERKFKRASRGGRGRVVLKRGSIETWISKPMVALGPAKAGEE
jgi:DNA gyrase subunit A